MAPASIGVPDGLAIVSTPRVALRGHQLGYRPKTNAYDAWDVPMWEQYIRDLAVFGSNAIELIPPRSDDAPSSPHFPLPQIDMMVEMSRLADEYGQDVWIWYPALDKDYGDPKQVEFALQEWAEVFSRLPRINAMVDVWHANEKGRYSHFDPDQKPYALRRLIETDAEGRYRFRSFLPPGYSIPPNSPT